MNNDDTNRIIESIKAMEQMNEMRWLERTNKNEQGINSANNVQHTHPQISDVTHMECSSLGEKKDREYECVSDC